MKKKILIPNVFQKEALEKLNMVEQKSKKSGVIVMPTGTGKTFLAVLWYKQKLELDLNSKLLFICHNNDILSQANEKEFKNLLSDLNIKFGYYNGSEKNIQQVTFATTQTLVKNRKKINESLFDYIIIDEAHHYQAKTFKKVIEYFKPKFLLGLTATPNRTDNKSIYDICGKKIYEAKISRAIKINLLTKINYYCVDNDIDFSNIEWNGYKYKNTDLNRNICIKKYDDAILKEYNETIKKKYNKQKTICFCATIEHCHRMETLFNKNGIRAVAYTSKTKEGIILNKNRRDKTLNKFREGGYDIIFVRDLFNEGVDIPDCDSIMMIRPTQSSIIFTQQIGRGLRKNIDKKDLLILDFTGNSKRCEINTDVISDMLDIDLKEIVKQYIQNNPNDSKNEFIYYYEGSQIKLNKYKIDLLNGCFSSKYSKEILIGNYKKLRLKLGRAPLSIEARKNGIAGGSIRKYFNMTYSAFVIFMGDKPNIHEKYSKEILIDRYKKLRLKLGRVPLSIEAIKNGLDGGSIRKYFNMTYTAFVIFMGDKPNIHEKYSKEILIDRYKKLRLKLGRVPLSIEARKNGMDGNSIRKYFNMTYNEFVIFMGDKPKKHGKYSKEILIDRYKKLRLKLGRVPLSIEARKNGIDTSSIRKYFNMTYSAFVIFMGDKPNIHEKYSKEILIDRYKKLRLKLGRVPTSIEARKNGIYTSSIRRHFNMKYNEFRKYVENKLKFGNIRNTNNKLKIINNYTPKNVLPSKPLTKKGTHNSYGKMTKSDYSSNTSKEEKNDIREKILLNINDGDTVFLLESPDLTALKVIDKCGIKPKEIVIPNNFEFDKLIESLQSYKTNLNIKCVNTSALQYLVDTDDKFDFIWLDYCGAFSYYKKDLDILFEKHLNNMSLVLTYNLFDPAKDDDNYYFTRVIDYVLSKIGIKSNIRLINDITYRYKRNMYNLGFVIKGVSV